MDYTRKLEYYCYLIYKKTKENEDITNKSAGKGDQKNIPTHLPELIDTFISGRITAEEFEMLKAKKKKLRREKRRNDRR